MEEKKFSIYTVVYNKLEELNNIKLDGNTEPKLIDSVVYGISALAEILAEGKKMRDAK